MNQQRSLEGCETSKAPFGGRKIESLDDITRELADRRLHTEYGEHIAPVKSEVLRAKPDVVEKPEEFVKKAREANLDPEGVLGFSTKLEVPGHILKGDVGQEIATMIHEDLHRLTAPETLREMSANDARHDLYEGVTEHFTECASKGLYRFEPGQVCPKKVEEAERLGAEVGDKALRDWYFHHEVTEELQKALDRIGG